MSPYTQVSQSTWQGMIHSPGDKVTAKVFAHVRQSATPVPDHVRHDESHAPQVSGNWLIAK